MIHFRSLEYHLSHGCNLACRQCSHYSNVTTGGVTSIEKTDREYSLWSNKIMPSRFAILGGEPTVNPSLIEHIQLARRHWSTSHIILVTNGLLLHRWPCLPEVLVETNVHLHVSRHGSGNEYMKRFNTCLELIRKWQSTHLRLVVCIRRSDKTWRRQYRVENGKPMPFKSLPKMAYDICNQKMCHQLMDGKIYKCPSIAYHTLFAEKTGVQDDDQWRLFREYAPLRSGDSNDKIQAFFNEKEIAQCSLCPSKKIAIKCVYPMKKDGGL